MKKPAQLDAFDVGLPTVAQLRAKIDPATAQYFDVHETARPFRCRTCRTECFWIRTEKGEALLVDCGAPGGITPSFPRPGRGVAHFGTCPHAKQWSRK